MIHRLPAEARIVWLSHGYGYGGDLMYFAPIFAGFAKAFPNTQIFVDRETILKSPALKRWFSPLGFLRLGIRRQVQGVAYESELKLPAPLLIWHLIGARPDLAVIVEFTPTALVGFFVIKFVLRKRVLLLIEGDPRFRGSASRGLWLKVKRWVARNADLVMTSNRLGKSYCAGTLEVPEARILVAPYLTSEIKTEARPAGEARRDEVTAPLILLFMNSLTDRKGILPLLSALLLLDDVTRDAVRLRIAGDGPLKAAVEKFLVEHRLERSVTLLGKIPYSQVGPVYEGADVFISSTMGDYRSLTGFEALSAGLPILISRYDGAHEEVVRPGENGFIIEPSDPQDIADRIAWFVHNRRRMPEMRQASKRIAVSFTFDAIAVNLRGAVVRALT